MKWLRHVRSAIEVQALPPEWRALVFYSEGPAYWTHLNGLIAAMLDAGATPICYLSSHPDDPGLRVDHERFRAFEIGMAGVRNWLFANIDARMMVMTMPDLHRFQVKRSRFPVHYVYVQHSLVSCHMAYREGAFDHYDTIFCAGPHQMREIEALAARPDARTKSIVAHGYSRLDAMIAALARKPRDTGGDEQPRVLIAPSWGEQGLIEMVGGQIVTALLEEGFAVTLRPHPQTSRLRPALITAIVARHGAHPSFALDTDMESWRSLREADVMISDWSGAAFEFAFARRRPVIFLDVPRKVNNPAYEELGLEPFESALRPAVGQVVAPERLDELPQLIRRCLAAPDLPRALVDRHVFNRGRSDRVGAASLHAILAGLDR